MRLQEDRSYGTTYGHPQIAYEQDGHQFGHDKELITAPIVEPPAPSASYQDDIAKAARSAKMKQIWAKKKAAQAASAAT